jgi:malonyl-CoA/methylmalonyl-CoA synthetase
MADRNLNPATFDRTDLVDVADEPDTLPHDILFHRLHFLACHQDQIAVRERHLGREVTYRQLLSDIINLKFQLLQQLHPTTIRKMYEDEEVAIAVFARGYEFVVAYFAILAVGGIVVPTSMVNVDQIHGQRC